MIASDFRIAESCLRRWMQQADVDDGHSEGVTSAINAASTSPTSSSSTCRSRSVTSHSAATGEQPAARLLLLQHAADQRAWQDRLAVQHVPQCVGQL